MTVIGTRSYAVDQATIDNWARASGDFNPLHVDPDYAAATKFGTTIAHGHFGLAQIEGLLLEVVGPGWLNGGVLHDLRFRAPVRPGSTCTVVLTQDDGTEQISVEIRDAATDTVVVTGAAAFGYGELW